MPTHFTPETMKFLRGLARHNDRDWFEPRRAIYERALRAPMLALVEEINVRLEEFAPEHVRPPNRIMMRIYRDTRFAKDKRPYKKHLSAWWARRGMEKTSGGGFYLQISPQEVLIAVGVFMPAREQLVAIRQWMADHSESYRAALQHVLKPRGKTSPGFEPVEPEALTRMPRGFAVDHPANELLRARNWGVHLRLPMESALAPSLSTQVGQRFRQATPLLEALNGAILQARRRAEPAAQHIVATTS